MNETIKYYNQHAAEFYAGTVSADMSYCQDKFLAYLPAQGCILDAGCGSGRDSKYFMERGYEVEAFDASVELCKLATKTIGKEVRCMRFEELNVDSEFDGIWASASLLHVSKADLPDVLQKMRRALISDGVLYASFKYGSAERVKDSRFFNDYTEDEVQEVFEKAGFRCVECFVTADVRAGRGEEKWVNVIGKIMWG
ncbi:MAG: methyltransferase domain-containing protein [Lachnospiraceae bacterium]|nr:methyltransferase domain-containing protein [Lachnospiraceae bacterium]